jgi:uncharacterized cupin superfamily protein
MSTVSIVDFRMAQEGEASPVPAERLVSGAPDPAVTNRFVDPTGQFFAGDWSSGVGKWRVEYSEHEFCQLTEGRVVLTAEDGREWRFGPGDAWVIPAGFRGTWETIEPARKRYAIFEPASR